MLLLAALRSLQKQSKADASAANLFCIKLGFHDPAMFCSSNTILCLKERTIMCMYASPHMLPADKVVCILK